MSFYGSVYYQLIDTYYKIIVKNGGDKNFAFNEALINPSGTADADLIESPAVGRKGVFTLDSGNYWINFSKIEDESGAPYRIWHAEPHKDEDGVLVGLYQELYPMGKDDPYYEETNANGVKEIYTKDQDGNPIKVLGENDYVQLKENDFFRVYQQKHDEAGHLYDSDPLSTLFRLPKSETSDEIDELQNYVGILNDQTKDDPFMQQRVPTKWVDDDPVKNIPLKSLFQYAEGHEDTIGKWDENVWGNFTAENPSTEPLTTIAGTVGNWTSVWGGMPDKSIADTIGQWALQVWGNEIDKTIAETIGNMTSFLDDKDDAPQDLVSAIGSLKDFFTEFKATIDEEGNPVTAEDARLEKFEKIKSLTTAIGNMLYFWEQYNGSVKKPINLTDAIVKNKNEHETFKTAAQAQFSTQQLAIEALDLRLDKIEVDLPAEVERAKTVEKTLQNNITAEQTRATGVETDIKNSIGQVTDTTDADTVYGAINKEVNRAKQVENGISDVLNSEIARSIKEDERLPEQITGINTTIGNKDDSEGDTLWHNINSLRQTDTSLTTKILNHTLLIGEQATGDTDSLFTQVYNLEAQTALIGTPNQGDSEKLYQKAYNAEGNITSLLTMTGSKDYEVDNDGVAEDSRISLYGQIKTLQTDVNNAEENIQYLLNTVGKKDPLDTRTLCEIIADLSARVTALEG